MLHQNSSKGNEESALLRTGFSCAISRLSIKVITFPVQKRKCLQMMESSCNIKGALRLLLAYYCKSLPFFK